MAIFCTHKEPNISNELCLFLKKEFGLNDDAIKLGKKHSQLESAPFPIILWTFGMITLTEYQRLLDWTEDNV